MLQERRKNLSIIKVLLYLPKKCEASPGPNDFSLSSSCILKKKTSQTFRLLDAMMDSLLSSQSCERANKSRSWDLKKYGAEGHSPITFLYVRFVRDGVQPSIGSALFTYEGKPLLFYMPGHRKVGELLVLIEAKRSWMMPFDGMRRQQGCLCIYVYIYIYTCWIYIYSPAVGVQTIWDVIHHNHQSLSSIDIRPHPTVRLYHQAFDVYRRENLWYSLKEGAQ